MRVLIVGAGIGGLSLALHLHALGLRPVIWEQAPRLEAVGAGVQLGPNATRLLLALGLGEALEAVAFEPARAEVRDGRSGDLRLSLPLGAAARERWGAPYLQVHRADLQAVLLAALDARDAADLQLDRRFEGLEAAAADVIVGADGVRSRVRLAVEPRAQARASGEVAWRALIPVDAPSLAPAAARVWVWPRRHLVAYPVRGGAATNLVAVTPGALTSDAWSEPADAADLRRAFADAEPAAEALLAAAKAVTRWSVAALAPLPRWRAGRAVLLGDAAHPMRPYLAQGAALAIEDGEALARTLAGGQGAVETRLARYEAERRPRATRVQTASARNGAIFHLPAPLSAAAFGFANTLDATRGGPAARLDWLYGYRPPGFRG